MLTAIGDTTEQTWKSLLEARCGISHIESFDASAFNCRIAGEIKHFDPSRFIEKKEIKKMGRFIQVAIAASEDALSSAGLRITSEEMAERVGVYIGSGIGGFEVIERELRNFLHSGHHRQSRFGIRIHSHGRERP
jgi:3-oxoacyl-[acyl-carrier-protein] synthase II